MKWTSLIVATLFVMSSSACTPTDEQLLKLAESGDVNAQFRMGYSHLQGPNILRDYPGALKWFRLAAEQGDAQACYHLGYMHELGRGVPQSYSEAYVWYSLAAAFGSKIAIRSANFAAEEITPQDLANGNKRVAKMVNEVNGINAARK